MAYTSGLTEQRDLITLQGVAEEAIGVYRIVTGGVATDGVVAATDEDDYPLGITGDAGENGKASYEDGDPVVVRYGGIAYLTMIGTGSKFDLVTATAGGRGTKFGNVSGQTTGWCIGVATKDWVDGEVIPVIIDRVFK